MIVKLYGPEHYIEVCSWFNKRDMQPVAGLIPPTGIIVPGVAAGFLISTDTECCIFEPFISNPDAPQAMRDEALARIMKELLNIAFHMGFKKIFGFSTNKTMLSKALDVGFSVVETGSVTVCKELKNHVVSQ